jgi:hypothetical protein
VRIIKRIIRTRFLTPGEAKKYQEMRELVEEEFSVGEPLQNVHGGQWEYKPKRKDEHKRKNKRK